MLDRPTIQRLRARTPALALALVALAGAASCGGEAPLKELPLAQAAAALSVERRAELESALAAYFGPSQAPAFAVLDHWQASGFDPNAPAPAGRDGDLVERIASDNEQRWFELLTALEAGEGVPKGDLPASLLRALDGAEDPAARVRTWQPDLTESARTFARECATCHGLAGGGDGPSSTQLDPPPRDLRSGVFEHRAPGPNPRPTQADLVRVQRSGVAGAGMPLFARLGAARQSGLADWVRYLALRGAFERGWLAHLDEHGAPPDAARMEQLYVEAWSLWAKLPDPPAPAETRTDASPNSDER